MCPLESEELIEVDEKLVEGRSETHQTKANKPCQQEWMKRFTDSGSEIEHEAFLVLWRHVFPVSVDVVTKQVHHIAIHLVRAKRIALAWLFSRVFTAT